MFCGITPTNLNNVQLLSGWMANSCKVFSLLQPLLDCLVFRQKFLVETLNNAEKLKNYGDFCEAI